jgi:hypothetical protein
MAKAGIYFDYDLMANNEIKESFKCLVCGKELACRWTDYHGEGVCLTCGTPYQLIHYDENNKRIERSPQINIKKEYIAKLQQYWEETKKTMSLGIYLGRNPEPENYNAVIEWLDRQ